LADKNDKNWRLLAEFWSGLDFIGIDMYRSLAATNQNFATNQESLTSLLKQTTDRYASQLDNALFEIQMTLGLKNPKQIIFKEIGYRSVENGFVHLTPHETVRLVRKELGNYIRSKILSAKTPEMSQSFQEPVNKLMSLAKKFSTETVVSGEYPPCIKHGIEVLEKGENLPHSGRFMLATFLLSRGQSIEQIAPLFKNAPDYNEKVTLYQLNHLSGTSGSGTKYSCPSCEKLKSQNLCFAIPECDNIINPLQFGKKKTVNA